MPLRPYEQPPQGLKRSLFRLSTDAIDDHGFFDPRYTCDLDNSSPELRWEHAPEHTAGYALLIEDQRDPKAIVSHWIVYNIPPSIHHLPAGIPPQESLPNGIFQGVNSFGKLGYSGPCPPAGGGPCRYVIRLLALAQPLPLIPPRCKREFLVERLRSGILAETEITGTYQRASAQKTG
ncbi:MAG: YbhB/YbcL family Raf kinase inhibitor-like protein [Bdellovibrionia bacterium]